MINNRTWMIFAGITVVAFGVWGALLNKPTLNGFPETLGYVVWSLTMIPPAIYAISRTGWKLELAPRAVFLGGLAGLLGAGGQLILFSTLQLAPEYLVFPFIALSPLVTVLWAAFVLDESVSWRGWLGIAMAILAGVLLSYAPPTGSGPSGVLWVALAALVLLAWGVQGFIIAYANRSMRAESIFFYMMCGAVFLSPIAVLLTDLSASINWGLNGMYLSALIQSANSVGALLLVYAFRYGKAVIVAPLVNAGAPVITIFLSLMLSQAVPPPVNIVGMCLAVVAAALMTIESEESPSEKGVSHEGA